MNRPMRRLSTALQHPVHYHNLSYHGNPVYRKFYAINSPLASPEGGVILHQLCRMVGITLLAGPDIVRFGQFN